MRSSSSQLAIFALLIQLAFASNAFAQPNSPTSKRVVYYYQTQFFQGDSGSFISLLPLISSENLNSQGKPYTTDVLVGAFHLGPEKDRTQIHLNDFPPTDARFATLWNQTATLQKSGINVNLYLGGAGDQSFVNLAANFSYYYPILEQTIQTYSFNGIDLDVEDNLETTVQIETLIHRLRSDFGQHFIITLAPVTSDLLGSSTAALSQINYSQLFKDVGSNISWFNVQFYSGFGTLSSTSDYTAIVNNGFPANVVVAGMLTNSTEGIGFVDITTVENTVKSLVKKFPSFGGVDGFEYFNALPGGTANPAQWANVFSTAMGGDNHVVVADRSCCVYETSTLGSCVTGREFCTKDEHKRS